MAKIEYVKELDYFIPIKTVFATSTYKSGLVGNERKNGSKIDGLSENGLIEMIKEIKSKGFPENVIPVLGDIQKTSFSENFFDRIIVNACFPHFENKKTGK